MVKTRSVTKEEGEKLKKQILGIRKARGDAIDLVVEIEATLDEILAGYFARPERFDSFAAVLWWEDFPFSLKIKLFSEVDLGKGFEKIKERIVKNLEELNTFRNRMAHGLAIFDLTRKAVVVGRKNGLKFLSVDKRTMKDFRKKASDTHASLHAILLSWAGVKPDQLKKSKSIWMPVKETNGHFLSKDNKNPKI